MSETLFTPWFKKLKLPQQKYIHLPHTLSPIFKFYSNI